MFKVRPDGMIVRVADGAQIPLDMKNNDYRAYVDWYGKGNRPESTLTLNEAVKLRSEDIAREFKLHACASISHRVGGVVYEFNADDEAIQNIMGVIMLITVGLPVPDPRDWTPLGSLVAVSITHAELIGLGGAIASRKDALHVRKKKKQQAIANLPDVFTVLDYDATADWTV